MTIYLPNPGYLPWHDLHHVATGYKTGLIGEAEISAYELRSGCRSFFIIILCVGAMMIATKSYALVQSGAHRGLVAVSLQPDIFPGMSEPDYLEAPWYDWAVAGLLTSEWSQMVFEAEQFAGRIPGSGPNLEQVALLRAAGEWHALCGEWVDALRCFQYCLQHNQQDYKHSS